MQSIRRKSRRRSRWVYDARTWVLADPWYKADVNQTGMPTFPLTSHKSFFIVFTTSPKRECYYDWAKHNNCRYIFMKRWTWDEIHFTASVSFVCLMITNNS